MFSNLRLPTAWPRRSSPTAKAASSFTVFRKITASLSKSKATIALLPKISRSTPACPNSGASATEPIVRIVKNFKPGEEAVLPLAPAQLFTGTVRYEDTGEPAPHARLTIWASQQKFGSMISVAGKADENGRYKISPNPGIRFGVTAYPPDGAPYLVVEWVTIPWEGGDRSKVVDVKLPRGVLVRGKVVEQDSNTPIVGASVQYHAEEEKNPSHIGQILTGWQDIHLTDSRGGSKSSSCLARDDCWSTLLATTMSFKKPANGNYTEGSPAADEIMRMPSRRLIRRLTARRRRF